jgi:hypothetical protein
MPTKKQRRRQQKLRRHEYEEVWVDAEGNVLEPDEVEVDEGSTNGAVKVASDDKRRAGPLRTSAGKIVPEPSWGRVLKRGLFFSPIMFVLIAVLPGGDRYSLPEKLFFTVQYVLMLIIFMYLTERLMYRVWQKRQARSGTQKR